MGRTVVRIYGFQVWNFWKFRILESELAPSQNGVMSTVLSRTLLDPMRGIFSEIAATKPQACLFESSIGDRNVVRLVNVSLRPTSEVFYAIPVL